MKKIPTMFVRDWAGDRSRVTREITPGCEWVLAGEGAATQKLDGTCCLVRNGRLYKRRELKPGAARPADFEISGHDDETGKTVGWVPVSDGPDDRYHREAWRPELEDGTYELIGPKAQGNPERQALHTLVRHGAIVFSEVPRGFDELIAWFRNGTYRDLEGLVFHHPDGRMAKIKKRDFGLPRVVGESS